MQSQVVRTILGTKQQRQMDVDVVHFSRVASSLRRLKVDPETEMGHVHTVSRWFM